MTINVKKLIDTIPKLNNPVMIEGLPGIGNVGKIVVDFLVDEMKAKKLYEVRSLSFPHSAFVDENNVVEIPSVFIYYKKFSENAVKTKRSKAGKRQHSRDILFLAGDVQPLEEEAAYEFSYKILDMLKELGGKEIITLGGIGLQSIPEKPKVYCTGSSKEMISKYTKGVDVQKNLYGVVGPIIGATGLLTGLAKEKDIEAACYLAETFHNPFYLGIKGGQKILEVLNTKLEFGIDMKKFGHEIEEVEKELMKRTKELEKASKAAKSGKMKDEANYIG
ncbi:hypothetical protein COV19_06055 [Candidatus Woesearchaeota archaeon CG10_big_fil_rev_8_21_14_0_10_44_13]|nr:MAG: hypothetical protein COV19_06055 [Candidatus Woesearchaeota archaeon CG10_big_fil_rev_8_21_14_0_10_44_13]